VGAGLASWISSRRHNVTAKRRPRWTLATIVNALLFAAPAEPTLDQVTIIFAAQQETLGGNHGFSRVLDHSDQEADHNERDGLDE
jgi:hypothetical protein